MKNLINLQFDASIISFQTIGLLLQIRIILRQENCTKMKFEDLLPNLSLLDVNAPPRTFVSRLELLAHHKYVVLHYTEDDELDEIEIKYVKES